MLKGMKWTKSLIISCNKHLAIFCFCSRVIPVSACTECGQSCLSCYRINACPFNDRVLLKVNTCIRHAHRSSCDAIKWTLLRGSEPCIAGVKNTFLDINCVSERASKELAFIQGIRQGAEISQRTTLMKTAKSRFNLIPNKSYTNCNKLLIFLDFIHINCKESYLGPPLTLTHLTCEVF